MGAKHYENFPVASLVLPAKLRRPVAAIYHFARSADDIADEGNEPAAERLRRLAQYEQELDRIEAGSKPGLASFDTLGEVVRTHRLPLQPFRNLLSAFAQDVRQKRYARFDELLDYCRRSADPVGRLLLHLFEATDASSIACSDRICSSLQLINFLQDVEVDFAKGRIYLPQDEMRRFGVSEEQIGRRQSNEHWRALMMFQIDRARTLLRDGAPLAMRLRGRIGLELRLIVAGGNRILDKLEESGGDVFRGRPVLTSLDWPRMLWRSLRGRGAQ
jgi:squalene synthase HpnC